jgi:hypothetical protein
MTDNLEPIETTDIDGLTVFAYVINGTEISDPTVSECMRFDVTPDYYGLTIEQVARLALLNQALADEDNSK